MGMRPWKDAPHGSSDIYAICQSALKHADSQSLTMIENAPCSVACFEPKLAVMNMNMLKLTDASLTNDIRRKLV